MMSLNIFILNGWAAGPKLWEPFCEALCKSLGTDRGAVHLLGWEEALDPKDYKRLALSFIENTVMENASEFIVVGWSLGAIVALDILPELRCNPKMLFLLSGSVSFCHEDGSLGWSRKAVEAMKDHLIKDRSSTLKTFYQRIFTRKERGFIFDQGLLESWDLMPEAGLLSGLDYLIQTDVSQKLAAADVPILWLHGDHDRICPIGGAKRAIKHLKQVQMVSLPEAGHGLFITNVEASIDVLNHFIKSTGIFSESEYTEMVGSISEGEFS